MRIPAVVRQAVWIGAILLALTGRLPAPRPVAATTANTEPTTYRLTQSTASLQLWTTPPSERVFKDAAVPTATDSEVRVYAARNEFEPFQVVVKPTASQAAAVSIDALGAGITAELYQVQYVNVAQVSDSLGRLGPYPDPLWPLANGATVSLTAGENTAFWFSLSVPAGAPAGDYVTTIHIGAVSIPLRVHVFNFAIPNDLHVASQMNFSYQAILGAYGVGGTGAAYWSYVDAIKQFFIDHRLTPTSVLWPGGLTGGGTFAAPFIDYDCGAHTLTDPYGIWGFDALAARYLGGAGLLAGTFTTPFNGGVGFSTFTVSSFSSNDSSIDQRPATFCGQTRSASDWLANPTSPYNQAWFAYVSAQQNYLSSRGYLDEAVNYFANEPQDQGDYNAVAWYSRYANQAAPNLKLMVSEGARPEIYANASYPNAHIDIWLPVLNEYDPVAAHDRSVNHGEETWVYFLYGTRPPYFNPITLDHPGVEGKFTGWFLWKYRVRGLAYYSLNDWSQNPWTSPMTSGHNGDTFMLYPPSQSNTAIAYGSNGHRFVPSIRFELMRDSLEDYEYLYLLAGGQPQVGQVNAADPQVDKVIAGLTSYTRNSGFLYDLRRLIGLKLGGEIAAIPDITPPPTHPRAEGAPGNYYINFQDPAGEPTADPLVVNGKTYLKIGSADYSGSAGYGWYSSPTANWMTTWLSSGPNVLQRSILFSDWGRPATFEFDLPNGVYNVTASVGWQGRTYAHQKVDIEGVSFVNDEATTPANSYLVRTHALSINDNKLTMAIGIFDEYTMLNYLTIEAANPPVRDLRLTQAGAGGGTATLTFAWTPASSAAAQELRYSTAPITAGNWSQASVLAGPLAGNAGSYAASVPYAGGTLYFALKGQSAQGDWSELSNLVIWPSLDVRLPVIRK